MEEARSFTKLAVVALIAAVRSIRLVLARDGSTGQTIADAAKPADMPALTNQPRSHTDKFYDPTSLARLA